MCPYITSNMSLASDDDDSDSSLSPPPPSPPTTPPIPRLGPLSKAGIWDRFSPPKRKRSVDRDSLPDEIPETPWRTNGFEDSGKTSPRSKKLVGQMSGMKLRDDIEEAVIDGGGELRSMWSTKILAPPATKRRRGSEKQPETSKITTGNENEVAKPSELASKNNESKSATSNNEVPADKGKFSAVVMRRLKSPPPEGAENVVNDMEEVKPPRPAGEDELSSDPEEFGIAYIPTPAQRDARRQKRLQQIKDYKSRESREARQQRIESRRRRRRSETLPTSGTEGETAQARAKKAVRFTD